METAVTDRVPFEPRELRAITVRAERIDPAKLIGTRPPHVAAEHRRTETRPTHAARHYRLRIEAGSDANVQLNHGDSADDEARLTAIAEDLLSPPTEVPA